MIRFYGGDPASTKALTPFLGEYFEKHLVEGMTREEVHGVIRDYRQVDVIDKVGDQVTGELFLLDPLETLAVWVQYEGGKFKPPVNIDRVLGRDVEIILTMLVAGTFLLLVGVLPLGRLQTARPSSS